MSSGRYIDLADPPEWEVNIDDIETSLNEVKRFNGHYKDRRPLTVAQHSLLTMMVAGKLFPENREVALGCLVHDWPEAYYGDIATPLKKKLGPQLKEVTGEIDKAVFDVVLPSSFDREVLELEVKICDLISLDIERRAMWKSTLGVDKWPEVPSHPFSNEEKQKMFDTVSDTYVNLKDLYKELV